MFLRVQYCALAGMSCPFLTGVDPIEKELANLKLKFVGVKPIVKRTPADGPSKIVITKYSHVPSMEVVNDALIVSYGSCANTAGSGIYGIAKDGDTNDQTSNDQSSKDDTKGEASCALLGMPCQSILARTVATIAAVKRSPALGLTAGILAVVTAQAQTTENGACDAVMEVEIHTNGGGDSYMPSQKPGTLGHCKKAGLGPEWPCPTAFPTFPVAQDTNNCEVVVVGGGTGGLYTALRLVDENKVSGSNVCVFEATDRVGGRLFSLRGLGPNKDLSVDAGGYRTWPKYTPVTHALITEYLKLNVACYENEDPCTKYNIADAQGNKIGFATMVERMMELLVEKGARWFPGHELVSFDASATSSAGGPVKLTFANGVTAMATKTTILNIPQRPLLNVIRSSTFPAGKAPDTRTYNALHSVQTEIVTKLYLYYKNAWWYDLGFKQGDFILEGDATAMPLKGRYHDGDVRCTLVGEEETCHGFLLAAYIHDFGGETAMYYRRFQADRREPVTIVSASTTEGKLMLDHAHDRLMQYHKYHATMPGMSAYEINKKLKTLEPPEFAVLATWNVGVPWAGGGWHGWTSIDYLQEAMGPLAGTTGIHVINEAFSNLQGWAEGTMMAADETLKKHFGVQPPWSFEAPAMLQVVRQTKKPEPECGASNATSSGGGGGGGGGGGANEDVLCFTKDARLRLANGTTIPLSHAQKGDQVWMGDGSTGPGRVTAVLKHPVHSEKLVAVLKTAEGELVADPGHPIFVNGTWMTIMDAHSQGHLAMYQSAMEMQHLETLWNLEIDGDAAPGESTHAYVVNGLVASGLGDNVELNLRYMRDKSWQAKKAVADKESEAVLV